MKANYLNPTCQLQKLRLK